MEYDLCQVGRLVECVIFMEFKARMSEYPYLKGVPIVRDILDCWSVEEVMGNFTPHGPSESEKGFAVPAQNFDREKFQALITCWRGLIGRWRSNRWRVMAARHWSARE